jgi:hypothetical protein
MNDRISGFWPPERRLFRRRTPVSLRLGIARSDYFGGLKLRIVSTISTSPPVVVEHQGSLRPVGFALSIALGGDDPSADTMPPRDNRGRQAVFLGSISV